MRYKIYKNCSEAAFRTTKEKLNKLNKRITDSFSTRLSQIIRDDDSDSLALNYSLIDKETFSGNLAIMFMDLPGKIQFEIVIIKTLDVGLLRYYKKEKIVESIPISILENFFEQFISQAITNYDQWDQSSLLNGEYIKPGFAGPDLIP